MAAPVFSGGSAVPTAGWHPRALRCLAPIKSAATGAHWGSPESLDPACESYVQSAGFVSPTVPVKPGPENPAGFSHTSARPWLRLILTKAIQTQKKDGIHL